MSTKAFSSLLLIASALVIIGAGLGGFGYYQSLQTITVQSTQTVTTTSTSVSAQPYSTTSETTIFSSIMVAISGTFGTNYNCRGNTVDGSSIATYGEPDGSVLLNAGEIHVTFSTQSSNVGVDFWIFTPSQISGWTNPPSCEALESLPNVYYGHNWSTYDGLISIPATGGYYFAFENYGSDAASVTISVTQVTASQGTNYVTQSTVYPTQLVTSVPQPAGLGPLFYVGIVAIILGIIVLAISRRTPSSAGATQQPMARPEAATVQEEPVTKENFCSNCGAKLAANAKFCKECGSAVT